MTRDKNLDDAIKATNEARTAARRAARLLVQSHPGESAHANRLADKLSAFSKALWSL